MTLRGAWLAGMTILLSADGEDGSNGLCIVPIVVSTFEAGRLITVCVASSQQGTEGSSMLTGVISAFDKDSPASSALRRPRGNEKGPLGPRLYKMANLRR